MRHFSYTQGWDEYSTQRGLCTLLYDVAKGTHPLPNRTDSTPIRVGDGGVGDEEVGLGGVLGSPRGRVTELPSRDVKRLSPSEYSVT